MGYGTQDEDKVTGAVTSVSGSDLGDLRSGIAHALAGRDAGSTARRRP